jgi:hypothetical protein
LPLNLNLLAVWWPALHQRSQRSFWGEAFGNYLTSALSRLSASATKSRPCGGICRRRAGREGVAGLMTWVLVPID